MRARAGTARGVAPIASILAPLLLLLLVAAVGGPAVRPVAGQPILMIDSYSSNECSYTDSLYVYLSRATGVCEPIRTLDASTAVDTAIGVAGARFGRAWCGDAAGSAEPTVTLLLYADDACTQLLAARRQRVASEYECTDKMRFRCSSTAVMTQPDWPPAAFAVSTRCVGNCTTQCASSAMPANQCVRTAPRTSVDPQSAMAYCAPSGGDMLMAVFADANCTALVAAQQQPANSCKGAMTLQCPSNVPVVPAKVPVLPHASAGFVLHKTGCSTAACDSGCRVDAFKQGRCESEAGISASLYCEASSQTAFAVFSDNSTCTAPQRGLLFPRDPANACIGDLGSITCPPNASYRDAPALNATMTVWQSYCGDNLPTQTVLMIPGRCAPFKWGSSVRLQCDASGYGRLLHYSSSDGCTGTSSVRAEGNTCSWDTLVQCGSYFLPRPAPTLDFAVFPDDELCSASGSSASPAGTVRIDAADGSCVALRSTTSAESPALIIGIEGALYGRGYCGAAGEEVTMQVFADAACTQLLGARVQAPGDCAAKSKATCSSFQPQVVQPAWPPAGFVSIQSCLYEGCSSCVRTAQPANVCSRTLHRSEPRVRSVLAQCGAAPDGRVHVFEYSDAHCTQDRLTQALSQPTDICKGSLLLSCPAAFPAQPSPAPVFPATSAGFAVRTSLCSGLSCSSGCVVSASRLERCAAESDGDAASSSSSSSSSGALSTKAFCAGSGEAVVVAVYRDDRCADALAGTVLESDASGSCQSATGQIRCPRGAADAPPAFGVSLTQWKRLDTGAGAKTCGGAGTVATTSLFNEGQCTALGETVLRFDCDDDAGQVTFSKFAETDRACAGGPTVSAPIIDGSCQGGIKIRCGTYESAATPAASWGSASMLSLLLATILLLACAN